MTHTPGPWKPSLFNIVTNVTGIIKEKRGDTKLQVNKGLLEILDDNESTVAFVNLEDTSLIEEDLANAILIAAAPDLLHALQLLTDPLYLAGLNQSAEHHPFIAKARLAITKATGEVNEKQ